jgi:hypothetical protein
MLYPTNPFRQIKGPISPHLIDRTGRRRRRGVPVHRRACRGSSRTTAPAARLLLGGNGGGEKVHVRTGTLRLPLGLGSRSLKCRFPLARAKLNAGGTWQGGCRRATAIALAAVASLLQRPGQSQTRPCHHRQQPRLRARGRRWPGLAWEASVNEEALIAAARPAAGIMRQLLIRICMLLRSVLCPVPASSGTAQLHRRGHFSLQSPLSRH